ncbi:interleukin-6 receptor subunit beta isoform 2-T2 [Rhinophrynus dorsalis]
MFVVFCFLVPVIIFNPAVSFQAIETCAQIIPDIPVVNLNSSFTAYCILNESCISDNPKIFWKVKGVDVPEVQYQLINRTVSRVTFDDPYKLVSPLTCNILAYGQHKQTVHGLVFTLGLPPDKPENLTCIVYDKQNLTCTWNPGRPTYLPTNYTLKHRWAAFQNSDCIPEDDVNNSCTIQYPNFQFYINSIFQVEAKNVLGEAHSKELIVDPINIAKPNPPVIKSLTSTVELPNALTVVWKNPMEMPNLDMKYNIRYRTNDSQEWEMVPPDETATHRTSFILQDLLPYTEYVVSLRCMKSNDRGYWSDWSKEIHAVTPEAKPNKGPDLWRKISNLDTDGNRRVQLMWKQLDRRNANGEILWYNVSIWKRKLLESHNVTSLAYDVTISKDLYTATVTAYNRIGVSPASNLVLPRFDNYKVQPPEIEVKAFPKDGLIWVEWTPLNKPVDGYVIEWCDNYSKQGCSIEWQREPNTAKGAFLRGHLLPLKRYLIKVYPLYKDGRESAASVEAYRQQGIPVNGPNVYKKDVGKYKAVLQWDPIPVDEQNGFIINYTLTYNPINGNKTTVLIDPREKEYTMKNLSSNTLYSVCMMAYTEKGGKASPQFSFTTLKFDKGQVEATVVSTCIGALLLVLIGFCLCFNKRDQIKKHIWPNVPDPSKSNIAQWSPQTPSRHEFNPKGHPFQDGSFTDVSVVEITAEQKTCYNEPDIKSMDPLKKNTSDGLSSGIGGSSCLSSPQLSVSDSDEVESTQNTSSTVQYSTVILSGYRDQQPPAAVTHVFSRSESTQPLLDSEERPDEQQAIEREGHSVVINQYFKQNCSPEACAGKLQEEFPNHDQDQLSGLNQNSGGLGLERGPQDFSIGLNGWREGQSRDSQVDIISGEIKSYLPQTVRQGGYMPQS